MTAGDELSSAVRGHCEPVTEKKQPGRRPRKEREREPLPHAALVFDTESTADDATQRVTFGSWALHYKKEAAEAYEEVPAERGLFYADGPGTPPENEAKLRVIAAEIGGGLQCLSQTEFLEVFFELAVKGRALVVGFNLPFDLSRIARAVSPSRKQRGGFSFTLWPRTTRAGAVMRNERGKPSQRSFHPAVVIKPLGPKKSSISFASSGSPSFEKWALRLVAKVEGGMRAPWARKSETNLHPSEAIAKRLLAVPKSQRKKLLDGIKSEAKWRGAFLDLSTLAHALTDRTYALRGAAKAWGCTPKGDPSDHPGFAYDRAYVEYCLQDVATTGELLHALLRDYAHHPIALEPWRAFSAASVGKAYLKAFGVTPPMQRWPHFPREALGIAQASFFGGRTSVRIRRATVPVVYLDFFSDYPTVNALLGNMDVLRAKRVSWVDCTTEAQELLAAIEPGEVFKKEVWQRLNFFAEVVLDGSGLFPLRAKFHKKGPLNIGVVHAKADAPAYHHGCDCVASFLMGGARPMIRRAWRVEPQRDASGKVVPLEGLRPVKLMGSVLIDPRTEDVFTRVIEERQRTKRDVTLSDAEKKRLDTGLKVLANSTSYGIYGQVDVDESDPNDVAEMRVHSGAEHFDIVTDAPEKAGPFFFAPIATSITTASRLLLALLEWCVRDLGGSYAFEDTDSMAVVATERGGLVPMPHGDLPRSDADRAVYEGPGNDATRSIRALSWEQVDSIVERFGSLSPYNRAIVKDSILKVEDVNRRPEGTRRQLYAYCVSSKRYAVFELDDRGEPVFRLEVKESTETDDGTKDQYSESGLGGIEWPEGKGASIESVWRYLVREDLCLPNYAPAWFEKPVVAKLPISSQEMLRAFDRVNAATPYEMQVKPFGFGLTARLAVGMEAARLDTSPSLRQWKNACEDVARRMVELREEARAPFLAALAEVGGTIVPALYRGKERGAYKDVLTRYKRSDRTKPGGKALPYPSHGTLDLFVAALKARLYLAEMKAEEIALTFLRGGSPKKLTLKEAVEKVEHDMRAERPGVQARTPEKPRLFAPLCKPEEWTKQGADSPWFDIHTGGACELDLKPPPEDNYARTNDGGPAMVAARSFEALVRDYGRHAETKSLTATGETFAKLATRDYRGPLLRRSVVVAEVGVIGKESQAINDEASAILSGTGDDAAPAMFRASGRNARLLADLPAKAIARAARVPTSFVVAVREGRAAASSPGVSRILEAARIVSAEVKKHQGVRDAKRAADARAVARRKAIEAKHREKRRAAAERERVAADAPWWEALDALGGIEPDLVRNSRLGPTWLVAPEFAKLPTAIVRKWKPDASQSSAFGGFARGNLDEFVSALDARGIPSSRKSVLEWFRTHPRARAHRGAKLPCVSETMLKNRPPVCTYRKRVRQ